MTTAFPGGAAGSYRAILITAVIVLLLATVAALAWWSTRDRELSVKPVRSGASAPLPSDPSSVHATATVPIAVITGAFDRAVPSSFPLKGRQKVCTQLTEQIKKTIQKAVGGDVGKFLGEVTKFITDVVTVNQTREVCQDVDYRVNINRNGAAQVTPAGDHVRIIIPISATGQAGFTGEVAKALALDKKNFRGALNAFADIRLDLTKQWCPKLSVAADFTWTNKAEFEIVHKWWINIDGRVGPKLRDMIQSAVADLEKKFVCDDVKKAISPFWRPYSFPIALPGSSAPVAFVNLVPLSVGFSGIKYQTSGLSAAFHITAKTEVTAAAATEEPQTSGLPPLQRIPAAPNQINLTLPVRVGYEDVAVAWSAFFKDRTFKATSPAGDVRVAIDQIELYPSEKHLVIAMHFTAKIGNRIFDTSGWVYIVAVPLLDAANQTLHLKNVTFTRQLDNDLWAILSVVFSTSIRQAIEDKATYDLKPDIAKLQNELRKQLTLLQQTQKLAIKLQTEFVGLKRVNVTETAIEVAVGLTGSADITIGSLTRVK